MFLHSELKHTKTLYYPLKDFREYLDFTFFNAFFLGSLFFPVFSGIILFHVIFYFPPLLMGELFSTKILHVGLFGAGFPKTQF